MRRKEGERESNTLVISHTKKIIISISLAANYFYSYVMVLDEPNKYQ